MTPGRTFRAFYCAAVLLVGMTSNVQSQRDDQALGLSQIGCWGLIFDDTTLFESGQSTGADLREVAPNSLLSGEKLTLNEVSPMVVATGSVEFQYRRSVLRADKVVLEKPGDRLIARGRVMFNDSRGRNACADTYILPADLGEAFLRALSSSNYSFNTVRGELPRALRL
jgi:lipopolysaccharide assembly outer membrane protein LptD (OstA)